MPIKNFQELDQSIANVMHRYGRFLLRISVGIIFVWFGALKVVSNTPAFDLIAHTVYWFDPKIFVPILGCWEMAIGLCLFFKPLIRLALFLLFLQMPGTALPLFILPHVCFTSIPFGLTLEGQYIVKNLVLISAAIVVGSTVREYTGDKKIWT